MPSVHCPFPSPFEEPPNPALLETAHEVDRLLASIDQGLPTSPSLHKAPLAMSMAGFLPRAQPEPFTVYLLWITWFILYDDVWCDALAELDDHKTARSRLGAFNEQALGIVAGRPSNPFDDPLIQVLHELWQRTKRLRPACGTSRLSLLMGAFFQASGAELDARLRKQTLPLSTYLPLRGHASGQCVSLEYERICHGFTFPPALFVQPHMITLHQTAAHYAVLLNDIYSADADRRRADPTRLAAALQAEAAVPETDMPTAAASISIQLANLWLTQRHDLETHIQHDGLHAYLNRIELYLGGTCAWHESMSSRYRAFP
ncbi:terpene synthase family protein [Streptomyces microflavus]|uniref:terpene synthase family protein n=1 Tax=Streptomyces microflavus TaxID=1919 RepID=UPI003663FDE5